MTTDAKSAVSKTGRVPIHPRKLPPRPRLREFPGLAAISLYMILIAGVICFDVVKDHVQPFYLIFSVLFIAGALGLMFLLRWGWALTLAAVAMISAFFLWTFTLQHLYPSLVQGLLNLVFFLYLIRPDLRDKMR
jgi:uncharacterized membrane protein (DUF2068 family)